MKNKVTVYCASSSRIDKKFIDSAAFLGKLLAQNNFEIVYGGGKVGLMGAVADAALENGGTVTGVIPSFMVDLELAHQGVQEMKIVDTMHTRQRIMMEESDFIITLPGGCGSLLELYEAISWKKLGLITSPIIIFNQDNYYDDTIAQLDKCVGENFMDSHCKRMWTVKDNIEDIIQYLQLFEYKNGKVDYDLVKYGRIIPGPKPQQRKYQIRTFS